jgi:hypothetical protein
MEDIMRCLTAASLFLSTGLTVLAQGSLPDVYQISITEQNRVVTATVIQNRTMLHVAGSDLSKYVSLGYNRTHDLMNLECHEGYRLTNPFSETGNEILETVPGLLIQMPVSNSSRKDNLTITCLLVQDKSITPSPVPQAVGPVAAPKKQAKKRPQYETQGAVGANSEERAIVEAVQACLNDVNITYTVTRLGPVFTEGRSKTAKMDIRRVATFLGQSETVITEATVGMNQADNGKWYVLQVAASFGSAYHTQCSTEIHF